MLPGAPLKTQHLIPSLTDAGQMTTAIHLKSHPSLKPGSTQNRGHKSEEQPSPLTGVLTPTSSQEEVLRGDETGACEADRISNMI